MGKRCIKKGGINMSDKSNYRKGKMQEIFDKVVYNVQNIVNSGEYEKFLRFRKNFRGYSFNNLIFIYSQFSNATRVAGKATWKKLNREIKKGEKPIYIVAPIPKKFTKKVKKIVDGEEIETLETINYNWYRWVYVYDISQTEGEDIPLQSKSIDGDNMLELYEKLNNISNIPIIEEEMFGGLKGYYSPKKHIIALRKGLSINEKTAVLLHELSHFLYDDFDYKTDRNLSEVFVESIAFMVADYFGLDTSMCSFNYITKWANGDAKIVLELGSKVQKCANELINRIENYEIQEIQAVA